MSELYHYTFDSNDFSEFDNAPGGTRLSTSTDAKLGGSTAGVKWDFAGTAGNGDDQLTALNNAAVTIFRVGFRFDLNTLALDTSASIRLFDTQTNSGYIPLRIYIRDSGSGEFCDVDAQEDDEVTFKNVASAPLPSGDITIEVVLQQATTTSSNDGVCTVYVNGVQEDQDSTLDNNTIFEDMLDGNTIFYLDSNKGGTGSGIAYYDEIIIRDDSTQIYPPPTSLRFLGFDADSEDLYISGLKDADTVNLYKYDLATLTESGPTGFGSATDTEIDNDTRGIYPLARPGVDDAWYLYGRDGNNKHVQYNLSGGGWSDIGDGGWSSSKIVMALLIDPLNPDDLIAVFDDNDIYRSEDNGSTWVKMGDAPASLIRIGARHPTRFNEIIVAAATPALYFSHNFGVSFDTLANPGGISDYYVVIHSDVGA